ncbi:MHYT domain-containing protein [Azospirillum sp. ST 5-10]|uniref:MHYT domain-containing protein n=1 Tax=unclassified Azospirillum TaxID=2630922 RepID=UPI003F49E388
MLARNLAAETGLRRRLTLAGAAFVLGTGIWTMHFVGMLALKLPVAIQYDPLLTLVSALAAILAVGVSVVLVASRPSGPSGVALASIAMGLGIATMHYLGMAAISVHGHMHHDAATVALSVAIAVVAAFLSLWLTFGSGRKPPLVLAAVAMALAISGMHYTAMWAVTFSAPLDAAGPPPASPALPAEGLAMVVAVVAFLISSAFLLALVPEGRAAPESAGARPLPAPVVPPAGPAADDRIPALRNGATVLLRPSAILYVSADAHYTHLFDGTDTYFCSLSISDLERRLDPARFLRVHRSHIVCKAAIADFRRLGSHGLVRLACTPPREVPVSRGRILSVQQALGV